MTELTKHGRNMSHEAQSSLLPPPDLQLRIRPADLARMIGVSKQTISVWIRNGKVTVGPDGRLNPVEACRQVMRNSDPSRLRSKMLRGLCDDEGDLRRQISERDALITKLNARVEYLTGCWDELDCAFEQFLTEIPAQWESLCILDPDLIVPALRELFNTSIITCGEAAGTLSPELPDDHIVSPRQSDGHTPDCDPATREESDVLFGGVARDRAASEEQGGGDDIL
jgi:hypothetical protein